MYQSTASYLVAGVAKAIPEARCRPSKVGTSNIYLLDKLQCPAILVECGFISNQTECIRLCNEEYQNRLCEAIVEGIIQFLK